MKKGSFYTSDLLLVNEMKIFIAGETGFQNISRGAGTSGDCRDAINCLLQHLMPNLKNMYKEKLPTPELQ